MWFLATRTKSRLANGRWRSGILLVWITRSRPVLFRPRDAVWKLGRAKAAGREFKITFKLTLQLIRATPADLFATLKAKSSASTAPSTASREARWVSDCLLYTSDAADELPC